MIEFHCPHCSRLFRIPDEYAGRTAKCKACGNSLTVPSPVAVTASAPPASPSPHPLYQGLPKMPMRTRRLLSDAEQMNDAFRRSNVLRIIQTEGDPPEVYRIEYRVRSLEPSKDPEIPAQRNVHLAEIQLTADYPRLAPKCKMLTPIFHPNIDPTHICVGDHWTAGERLVDLVVRIGEMLAYQAYNIKSPLDAQAAMWADLNVHRLPTDPRTIRPAELE
jgi:ubiquitin-protein ligase